MIKKLHYLSLVTILFVSGCAVSSYDAYPNPNSPSNRVTTEFYSNLPSEGSVTIIQQQAVPVYVYPNYYNDNYYNYHYYRYPRGTYFPYRPPRLGDHPPCRNENCKKN